MQPRLQRRRHELCSTKRGAKNRATEKLFGTGDAQDRYKAGNNGNLRRYVVVQYLFTRPLRQLGTAKRPKLVHPAPVPVPVAVTAPPLLAEQQRARARARERARERALERERKRELELELALLLMISEARRLL